MCGTDSVEAEYVVACSASCEALWMRKLLSNLFDLQLDATCIHCDNQSCVKLSENLVFHDKSKHIEIKYQGYGVERSSEAPVCFDGGTDS